MSSSGGSYSGGGNSRRLRSALPWLAAGFLVAAACSPSPPPAQPEQPDPAREAWYGETVEQLTSLNLQAEGLLRRKKAKAAGEMIIAGEPLSARLLSVPRPTLAAVEAVSDRDHLYAQMLLRSRNYGWARMFFQKNVARWRNWRPQTADTARRTALAESGIAECDMRLESPGKIR